MRKKYCLLIILCSFVWLDELNANCFAYSLEEATKQEQFLGTIGFESVPCMSSDEPCLPCLSPVLSIKGEVYFINGMEESEMAWQLGLSIEELEGASVSAIGFVFDKDGVSLVNIEQLSLLVEDVPVIVVPPAAQKQLRDGILYLVTKDGAQYTAQGVRL
ncbi:MAG: hypothetical protein IJ581_02050 [Paludibacteraceae bacterium]|nr:hypothetical protein [Paludibacteraceae bacterium]